MTVKISLEILTIRKSNHRPTIDNTISIGNTCAAYIKILCASKAHLIANIDSSKRINRVIEGSLFDFLT